MIRSLTLLLVCTVACPALETTFTNVEDGEELPVAAEHATYEAVIHLKNPYDRAVRVTRVESTCACSKLELANRFLLPHQETELAFAVDNHRRSGVQRQVFRIELSDPQLPVIDVKARWRVIPDIAVDAMPESGPFDRRPESARRRNVYAFTSNERPDELGRLREIIRLASPAEHTPEGGLEITAIDYEGRIWGFTQRRQDEHTILLIAHAKDPEATIAPGKYVEKVIIRTNHPKKPEIELTFYCAINPDAGKADASDPWASMR